MAQRASRGVKGSAEQAARRRVTMTDVARLAECSQSTVSVVLNNTPGIHISAATRERVFAAARQLKYEIARSTDDARRAAEPGRRRLRPHRHQPRGGRLHRRRSAKAPGRPGMWSTICESLDNPEMERRALDALMHSETDLVIYATIMTRKVEVPRRLYAAEAARRAAQLLHRRPRLPERRAGRGGGRAPGDRRADRRPATGASPSSPASCGWTPRATA